MSSRHFSKEAVRFLQTFQFLNEAHLELLHANSPCGQSTSPIRDTGTNHHHHSDHSHDNRARDAEDGSRLPLDSLSIGDLLFTMNSWHMLFFWVKAGLAEKARDIRSRHLPLQRDGSEEDPSAHVPLLSPADYAVYQLQRSDSHAGLMPAAPTPDDVLACDLASLRRSYRAVTQLEEQFTHHLCRDVLAPWLQDVLLLYVDCTSFSSQDIQHDLRSLLRGRESEVNEEEEGDDDDSGGSLHPGLSTSGGGEPEEEEEPEARERAPSSDVGVLLYFLLKQLFTVELQRLRTKTEMDTAASRVQPLPYVYSLCPPYDCAATNTLTTPYIHLAQSPQTLLKMLRLVRLYNKGSRQVDTDGLVLNWPSAPPQLTASPAALPIASPTRGRLPDPFRRKAAAEVPRQRVPSLTASATSNYKKKKTEQVRRVAQLGGRPPFYRLPLDVQQHVLEYLPPRYVRVVSRVCRAWQYLVAAGSPTLRHYAASSSAVTRAYVHFYERVWGVGALRVLSSTTIQRLEMTMDSAQVRRLDLSWAQAQNDPVARRRMDDFAAMRTSLLEAPPSFAVVPPALTFAAPPRAPLSVCVFVGYLLEFRAENRGTCAALEHVLQALWHEVKWRAFSGRERRASRTADLCETEALDRSLLLWTLLHSDRGGTPSVVEALWRKWPHVCETWEAYRGTATVT